jgi:hypothetical protein
MNTSQSGIADVLLKRVAIDRSIVVVTVVKARGSYRGRIISPRRQNVGSDFHSNIDVESLISSSH